MSEEVLAVHTKYETIEELLSAAEIALEKGVRRHADRILLFDQVVTALKGYVEREKITLEARRELRASIHTFLQTVRDARSAIDDWNLGVEITRRLAASLRDCISAMDKIKEAQAHDVSTD